ncbi:hypothetical protein FL966_06020 [Caproiciproducens galactitolivorans]|uniref:Uncharacterized protein n=2 Tax=Caproiciproducens galactitolivorans TaxID=642589 RepID=A0A4Z0YE56_9FIRM|nr:hypothetical protein FL966_06020 [Caproiciproducens galactitolivorans]TGJ75312.1 hypothetical protein CAGA_25300 [Caproiciproducens galactitolivorans]
MVSRAYAAWRAECIKADIEMGFYKDDDVDLDIKNAEKRERRRKYMSEYYIRHRAKHRETARKSYLKKKAAPLLAQEKRHNKK